MPMTELVLDKSFLDGASHQLVSEACVAHRALCTESLFFGLMTIKPESQDRCFAKLPDRPHSLVLIPNVGLKERTCSAQNFATERTSPKAKFSKP
jgi:hypothetical protein